MFQTFFGWTIPFNASLTLLVLHLLHHVPLQGLEYNRSSNMLKYTKNTLTTAMHSNGLQFYLFLFLFLFKTASFVQANTTHTFLWKCQNLVEDKPKTIHCTKTKKRENFQDSVDEPRTPCVLKSNRNRSRPKPQVDCAPTSRLITSFSNCLLLWLYECLPCILIYCVLHANTHNVSAIAGAVSTFLRLRGKNVLPDDRWIPQ